MNICLIKPLAQKSRTKDSEQFFIDIGLGFLGSALRKSDFKVEILDCILKQMNVDKFRNFIKENKFDVYGFKIYSFNLEMVKQSIDIIKEVYPDSTIVVGGPHPSGVAGQIFNQLPSISFAFQGEAEIGLPQLLIELKETKHKKDKKNNFKNIPGLIWKDNGAARCNPPVFTEPLDNLGFPAWDLLDIDNYLKNFENIRYLNLAKQYIPVLTSRGCPFPCSYCEAGKISGKKMRYHSIDYVIEWIKYLKDTYGVKHFAFVDDALTLNKKRFMNICEAIIKNDLKIKWDCAQNAIRFDNLDKEMLELMERSGCNYMSVAIESGSDKILKDMQKDTDLELANEKVDLIKRVTNIVVVGFFIIGYPTETREDIKKTIKFSKQLNLDLAVFYLFTPHPGTEIADQLFREKKLNSVDWGSFNYDQASIPLDGISKLKLKLYRKYAYFSFYIRPKILKKVVFEYINPAKNYANFSKAVYRYLVH